MPSPNPSRYRLLVENSTDLVAEVSAHRCFLYVSPNFENLLGYRPEELIGTDVFAQVHPDDVPFAQNCFALPEASATLRFRHKSGAWRWLDANGRDFTMPSGEVRSVIIARDVTERREAEEALRHSEQHLRAILDNAFVAVVGMSEAGFIDEWNSEAERLFGWHREEIIGKKMVDVLVPEPLRAQHEEGLDRYLRTGEARHIKPPCALPLLHRNSYQISVELSITPIVTISGLSFCAFIRDLTGLEQAEAARTRLEAQLYQSQKLEAIGRLAGGIAHDFNNILAVITANNELASMEVEADHPAAECHTEIHRACQRAADLVRQILSFSRPQPSARRVLDLSAVVREAVRMLRPILPASIEIKTSLDSSCAAVSADSSQLMQVLLNLATNAAHAMRENAGLLEFSLQCASVDEMPAQPDLPPGQYAKLTVRDTGHGMDATTLAKIFEPFFTTKSVGEGTGLGLSVVHGIVKSHGGAIQVSSHPGEGTLFQIFLPVADVAISPVRPSTTNVPLGRGQTVLFVEDEPSLAESGRRILRRIGYEPTVCNNVTEALEVLKKSSFAVIVCDLAMPGRSGTEFAEECRRRGSSIPFVLTSGSSGSLALEALEARGVTALLEKPFTPQALAETLQRVLSKHQTSNS